MKSRSADPFAAVADPTRRGILELLRDEGPRTAGALGAAFPTMSRAAVSKHLGVLRRARLVRAQARGREIVYRLDSGPLVTMYGEWLASFLPVLEDSLPLLKERAEGR